jgi:hypothetical protein
MKVAVRFALVVLSLAWLVPQPPASAVSVGQVDTFQDGTTQNWTINVLGFGSPPLSVMPANVATGGPSGAGDRYLQLTALGGAGAGSKLTVNNLTQWTGNYLASGVTSLSMTVRNFGDSELSLRLLFEDPMAAPPQNVAVSSAAVLVPAGSGWMSVVFPISLADLTAELGTAEAALTNTTQLRLFHGNSVSPFFPGPPIVAILGVDNLQAVPEPSAILLLGLGISGLARLRRWA